MIACNNIPDFSVTEKASTFAVLSVDVNSLDEHDKIVIGGIQEEVKDRYDDSSDEEKEEEKIDTVRTEDRPAIWTEKLVTSIEVEEQNPMYKESFTFNSGNMAQMKYKIQIFQTAGAAVETV